MSPERKQIMLDVLTTAVEGGINYWAAIRKVKRDDDLNVLSFECKDAEDLDDPWLKMTVEKLDKAIETEAENKESQYRRLALQLIFFPEEADYDAGDADNFVQLALFGEVRYG